MSQWNNAYAYNNQYQWNNEPNPQYMNQQQYYASRDSSNQYVSFNEFLSQMQTNPTANAASYNNMQYENYPREYNYQNVPSGSQNPQHGYAATSSALPNSSEYNTSTQNQYTPVLPDSYPSEMILNSNLTATATEFVPKTNVQPSSSTQNIPESTSINNDNEASSYTRQSNSRSNNSDSRNNFSTNSSVSEHRNYTSSSSDTNWRDRPSNSQQNDATHKEGKPQEFYRNNDRNRDSKYRNEQNGWNYESNSRNQDSNGRNYDSNYRNQESNRHYENQSSNGRQNESTSQESNGRQYDSYRNQESGRNQDSSSRYDRNYDKRGQNKVNYNKSKNKDDVRTFYNSGISKDAQDVRKGEGSGRGRGWAGSQRLRAMERNSTEDEQYANNYYAQKEEKREERDRDRRIMKSDAVQSPSRVRNKQNNTNDQVNTDMTQRERLSDQLDRGTLECLVCCERVKQMDPVWSCSNCYHVLHLRCIRKWAMSSLVEGKWRCPACQNPNEAIPTEYRCMCGAVRSPEHARGAAGAHTCGRACRRLRACPHPCTLLCHPGPCPPCQATVTKKCGCGTETRSVLCSSKLPQVCGRQCGRTLLCGQHNCAKDCHEGPCDVCQEIITQVCYCPAASSRAVPCSPSGAGAWACGAGCGRVLSCGAHVCRAPCHAPPCAPCARDPATLRTCPCGHTKLDPESRKSCTDPVPLCGNICAKPLPCGPAGDKHFCKLSCHEGPCPVCPDSTVLQCRCGHSSREVPCADLPEMYNNVLCQKKCNKKLSCGRHRCRTVCCSAASHRCAAPCGRSLACQTHRCEEFCHTGHCAPCPRLSFEELSCECGAEVLLPPIRCGTRPPACRADCVRPRPCAHAPHHACHAGDCPPCVVLTTKRCHGDHEERKTIPCSQEEFSCGLPCGKPLPCGKHTCIKTCHKGPCDAGKCTQPCRSQRASCGHECGAACHGGACPAAAPCRAVVRATCRCRRRAMDRYCTDNARDYNKMMSALAATKMAEGGSVDISEVQRPGNMLKTLECDDECRVEARTRQLALALQIRNPDVSAKLAPRYSEHVRTTAAKEPAFAQQIHDKLTELVQLAKKSKQKTRAHSFPSMNWQKRQFIHEMCEHFGCEGVAYDAEPNRNVVATADREKSWLPAMSILEVLGREAGKRRVPGPVLRAAPSAPNYSPVAVSVAQPAAKSTSGWATLTSTNAWAARSQQNQKPADKPTEKIDYFDNPPDN